MKRRFLAVLMSVLLVATLLPVTAMAEGKVAQDADGTQYDTVQQAIDAIEGTGEVTLLKRIPPRASGLKPGRISP